MKKKQGSMIVEGTIVFMIIIIMILIIYSFTYSAIKAESEMVFDDLVTSELAVFKNVDLIELSKSKNLDLLIINEKEQALETFKEYLKINLNLNDDFTPTNSENYISGKVGIDEFTIYNVYDSDIGGGNNVKIWSWSEKGGIKEDVGVKGVLKTPNSKTVENTTIYAKISLGIKMPIVHEVTVHPSQTVDITKQ